MAAHALSQHRVWGVQFEAAVITNLTRDHLDYYHTMQDYAAAKAKLFAKYPLLSVLNRDDEWYDYYSQFDAEQKITYGTHKEADCRIIKARLHAFGSKLRLKLEEYELDVKLHIPGQYNAINALCAASVAYGLEVKIDDIAAGLEEITSIPGRMQLIDEGQDFLVVVDHAHTEDALNNLLTTLRTTLKGRLITVIGGDGDRDPGKREPIGKLVAEKSELVIVADQEPYTEDPDQIRAPVLKGAQSVKHGVVVKEIPDRKQAIAEALRFARKGDVVVIPGMGNQLTMATKDGKIPWFEPDIVRELLKEQLEK